MSITYANALVGTSGEPVVLSREQASAFKDIVDGHNVLISGPAGTGKSTLLAKARERFGRRMAVTASTGIAALNVGGTTLHTFAGLGLGKAPAHFLAKKIIEAEGRAFRNIRDCRMLSIDEISMASADLLDKVDQIFRLVRGEDRPFGGVQLLAFGDFCQLPPVAKEEEDGSFIPAKAEFAFRARVWAAAHFRTWVLTKTFRQQDQAFADALGCLRVGDIYNPKVDVIAARVGVRPPNDGIRPTIIHTHNKEVDAINVDELAKLPGPEKTYSAIDSGYPEAQTRLDRDCLAPKVLRLKVGAQVMLLANINLDEGLANGRMGVVTSLSKGIHVRFDKDAEPVAIDLHEWEVLNNEAVLAKRSQYPLRLAWAITSHKCVSADTRIATDRGLLRIGDIPEMRTCPQNQIRPVASGLKAIGARGAFPVSEVFRGTVESGYRITTRHGYEIIASARHPILRINEEGASAFVKAPEIRVGDSLRLRSGARAEGDGRIVGHVRRELRCGARDYKLPTRVTGELAWLLGALVGDGCVSDRRDGRIDITNMDAEVLRRFDRAVRVCFGINPTQRPARSRATVSYFHNRGVRDFLEYVGLGYETARAKAVPEIIFTSSTHAQRQFLRGLFDTDGGVNSCVHFTTTSLGVAKDVQLLLLNLGIRAALNRMRFGAARVSVYGCEIAAFLREIGFSVRYKQQAARKIAKRALGRKVPKTNVGRIPNGQMLASRIRREIARVHGMPYGGGRRLDVDRDVSKLLSRITTGQASLTDASLRAILKAIPDAAGCGPTCEKLLGPVRFGIITDTVVSVERVDAEMMDIGVPNDHTFIGAGFVNHNCQGLTLDRIECHLGNCFAPGQAYVAASRVKTLEGLFLRGTTRRNFTVHPDAIEFYRRAAHRHEVRSLPGELQF